MKNSMIEQENWRGNKKMGICNNNKWCSSKYLDFRLNRLKKHFLSPCFNIICILIPSWWFLSIPLLFSFYFWWLVTVNPSIRFNMKSWNEYQLTLSFHWNASESSSQQFNNPGEFLLPLLAFDFTLYLVNLLKIAPDEWN